MRFRSGALWAASTVTILGTALATAVFPAPAQASRSGAHIGHPVRPVSSLAGAAQAAALRSATGVISGVVDGVGGRPLTGVCVIATGPGGSSLAVTRSDGRYILGGLRPGGYTLHYSGCAVAGQYVDQWSGGASLPVNATTVSVANGQSRALAPVTLRTTAPVVPAVIPAAASKLISASARLSGPARLGAASLTVSAGGSASSAKTGAIAGRVTGGGKPLKGICVAAEGPSFTHALTSKAGKFQITKLRPGRYIVFYTAQNFCGKNSGNWLFQYYKNINGPVIRKQPTRVPVTAGHTTNGINAALELGGQISGTVRSQGGKTVSRVCVLAQGRAGKIFFETLVTSGKDGSYALHSLFPGKYTVVFVPRDCGSTGNFIPQWWRNSPNQKHAVTIVITRGLIVRKVDATLRPGAIINGVVRGGGPHGALLKRICVDAEPTGNEGSFPTYGFTQTNKNGSYQLSGLTTGKYQIFFSRGCGNSGNFLPVRRTLSVVAGHTTSGFDTVLPFGAIISGKVTGIGGTPVHGICVSTSSGRGFGAATTKKDGTYSIIALPTGHYTLNFSGGCGNPGSYAPQFYKGQDNIASATAVLATAGRTTAGINAAMQPGGTISGVLTDSSGKPVNRACVALEPPGLTEFGYPYYLDFTGKNGAYAARNLEPGVYAVNFGCFFGSGDFASQWFMGQPGSGLADFVSAPAGLIASGISAVMKRGGFITGTVTNSAGKPLSGQCVEVTPHASPMPSAGFFFNRSLAFTNSHGVYRIGPLAATSYDVQFSCFGGRNASQWYRNTTSRASAKPVPVSNSTTTTGINATLTAAGSISGEVTTGANKAQSRVCVSVEDVADNFSGFAETNSHGRYTVGDLSSGAYQVTFSDCGFGRHHTALGTATRPGLVTVSAPHAVTGVNEKLFPAGSISGLVRGEAGATLQAGACVVAVPVSPNTSIDSTQTSSNGGYRLTGLAPGKYQVNFGDPFCFFAGSNYAPQWFNDQASQATATTVTVTSGHNTSAVTATLGSDGAITGTVTSHSRRVAGECVTATPVDPVADPLLDSVLDPVIGVTVAHGTYALVGLLPGKYTVKFSVGCGDTGFRTQWWRHASSASDATVITVSANGTVTGIDAHLHGG